MLAAEVVERDVFRFDTKVFTHLRDALVHDRRTTEVVLDIFRSRMIFQVIVNHDLVDKAYIAVPIVFGKRFGQSDVNWKFGNSFSNARNSSI